MPDIKEGDRDLSNKGIEPDVKAGIGSGLVETGRLMDETKARKTARKKLLDEINNKLGQEHEIRIADLKKCFLQFFPDKKFADWDPDMDADGAQLVKDNFIQKDLIQDDTSDQEIFGQTQESAVEPAVQSVDLQVETSGPIEDGLEIVENNGSVPISTASEFDIFADVDPMSLDNSNVQTEGQSKGAAAAEPIIEEGSQLLSFEENKDESADEPTTDESGTPSPESPPELVSQPVDLEAKSKERKDWSTFVSRASDGLMEWSSEQIDQIDWSSFDWSDVPEEYRPEAFLINTQLPDGFSFNEEVMLVGFENGSVIPENFSFPDSIETYYFNTRIPENLKFGKGIRNILFDKGAVIPENFVLPPTVDKVEFNTLIPVGFQFSETETEVDFYHNTVISRNVKFPENLLKLCLMDVKIDNFVIPASVIALYLYDYKEWPEELKLESANTVVYFAGIKRTPLPEAIVGVVGSEPTESQPINGLDLDALLARGNFLEAINRVIEDERHANAAGILAAVLANYGTFLGREKIEEIVDSDLSVIVDLLKDIGTLLESDSNAITNSKELIGDLAFKISDICFLSKGETISVKFESALDEFLSRICKRDVMIQLLKRKLSTRETARNLIGRVVPGQGLSQRQETEIKVFFPQLSVEAVEVSDVGDAEDNLAYLKAQYASSRLLLKRVVESDPTLKLIDLENGLVSLQRRLVEVAKLPSSDGLNETLQRVSQAMSLLVAAMIKYDSDGSNVFVFSPRDEIKIEKDFGKASRALAQFLVELRELKSPLNEVAEQKKFTAAFVDFVRSFCSQDSSTINEGELNRSNRLLRAYLLEMTSKGIKLS